MVPERWQGRLGLDRHRVGRAAGDGLGKRERSVGGQRKVVAGIILEHEPVAGQARHRAADRERIGAAGDVDARHVGAADDAGAVRHGTHLVR